MADFARADGLKPPLLMREITPKEFSMWLNRWDAYYTVTRLANTSWRVQHEVLHKFLEPNLSTHLRLVAVDGMPVPRQTGDPEPPSLILRLTEIVQMSFRGTLMAKRVAFIMDKQPQDQEWIKWFFELKYTAYLADIEQMTVEDWLVVKGMVGCTDDKLREELMDIPNPTVELLMEAGNSYRLRETLS